MIMSLYPYIKQMAGRLIWVFDDEAAGLKAEAFVMGMSEMLTELVLEKDIPDAVKGFKISFSNEPFSHDVQLMWDGKEEFTWDAAEDGQDQPTSMIGNWYIGKVGGHVMRGWLCPALLLYFKNPPEMLYVKAEPLPEGVNPIWHDAKQTGRRFVGTV